MPRYAHERKWYRDQFVSEAVWSLPRCDLCGGSLPRESRYRLMWETAPGGELILADLCERCAFKSDALFGGLVGGGTAVRLPRAEAPRPTVVRGAAGLVANTIVYVLIALAVFLLVTLVSGR
jgi:hypothetical protein